MNKIFVVSEIGSNHNGDIDLAFRMINESIACGADAVKFQTFDPDELVSVHAPMAEYQKKNLGIIESQKEMLQKLVLGHENFRKLFEYAHNRKITIFSTPFDDSSVSFLASLGQKIWKIPSGEITNLPLLEKIAKLDIPDKEIILSTGMASLEEIRFAVSVIEKDCRRITILHCVTDYPADDEELNLQAILQLKEQFPEYNIGYSDHSRGITASLVASGMGITMVEKHFTLDKNLPGPDHKASIDPAELRALCREIKRAEIMLGKREKIVAEVESQNRIWARKSIVAKKAIKTGEIFSIENITCKRPGYGISPTEWYNVIGKKAKRNFESDELIEL